MIASDSFVAGIVVVMTSFILFLMKSNTNFNSMSFDNTPAPTVGSQGIGVHGRRLLRCRVSICSLLWATTRRPGGVSELALLSQDYRHQQPERDKDQSASQLIPGKKPRTSGLWMSNEGSLAVLAVDLGYLL